MMFDYLKELEKTKAYQKRYPEFGALVEKRWKEYASFTMDEIIPTLETTFANITKTPCQITCKISLKENSLKDILKMKKMYHLSLTYYLIPKSETFTPYPHIIRNKTLCKLQIDENGSVILVPITEIEITDKEKLDIKMNELIANDKMMLIATEERDIDFEELRDPNTWQSKAIPFEERNMTKTPYIQMTYQSVIEYIEERENKSFDPEKHTIFK